MRGGRKRPAYHDDREARFGAIEQRRTEEVVQEEVGTLKSEELKSI